MPWVYASYCLGVLLMLLGNYNSRVSHTPTHLHKHTHMHTVTQTQNLKTATQGLMRVPVPTDGDTRTSPSRSETRGVVFVIYVQERNCTGLSVRPRQTKKNDTRARVRTPSSEDAKLHSRKVLQAKQRKPNSTYQMIPRFLTHQKRISQGARSSPLWPFSLANAFSSSSSRRAAG